MAHGCCFLTSRFLLVMFVKHSKAMQPLIWVDGLYHPFTINLGMVYYCLTNITRGIQTASPAAKGATAATAANRIRRTREAIDATSERVVEKKSWCFWAPRAHQNQAFLVEIFAIGDPLCKGSVMVDD